MFGTFSPKILWQTLLENQIKKCKEQWYRTCTVFSLTSRRTEIAKCLQDQKARSPCTRRTGNHVFRAAKFGDLTTMQSWCKIWLLNGCNHCRAKPNLLRKQTRVHESFSRCRKSQESLKLSTLWSWSKSCDELSLNHCTSTLHRFETNGIAERAVRRIEEETSSVPL